MEIVGEADRRLDEGKRQGKAGGGSGEQESDAAMAEREPGDAHQGAEKKSESGVLLDKERNDEQNSAEKGWEWRKV